MKSQATFNVVLVFTPFQAICQISKKFQLRNLRQNPPPLGTPALNECARTRCVVNLVVVKDPWRSVARICKCCYCVRSVSRVAVRLEIKRRKTVEKNKYVGKTITRF